MNKADVKNYSKELKALSPDITDDMVKFTMTPEFEIFMLLKDDTYSSFIDIDFEDKEYDLVFNFNDSSRNCLSYIRENGPLNKFNNFVSLKESGFVMLSNCDTQNFDLYDNDI